MKGWKESRSRDYSNIKNNTHKRKKKYIFENKEWNRKKRKKKKKNEDTRNIFFLYIRNTSSVYIGIAAKWWWNGKNSRYEWDNKIFLYIYLLRKLNTVLIRKIPLFLGKYKHEKYTIKKKKYILNIKILQNVNLNYV